MEPLAHLGRGDPREEPALLSEVGPGREAGADGRDPDDPASEPEQPSYEDLERTVRTYRTALRLLLHDAFEPLAKIRGLLQVLRDDPWSKAETDAYLSSIVDDLERIGGLFETVAELERLPDRAARSDWPETDLAALIHEVLRGLDHSTHDVRLDIEHADPPLDRTLVARVLANLVGNALTHTPIGTTVWIRTRTDRGRVEFVVEDDGPGIPEDVRGRIFEPFERGISPDSTPGVGLGLALVRGIAEMLGGSVTLEEGAAGGASFRMVVPLRPGS